MHGCIMVFGPEWATEYKVVGAAGSHHGARSMSTKSNRYPANPEVKALLKELLTSAPVFTGKSTM